VLDTAGTVVTDWISIDRAPVIERAIAGARELAKRTGDIMRIKGSVAPVTAANRGFGRQLSAQLVARGAAKIYAAARKPETITAAGVVPIRMTSPTWRR
jgi:hypothetical protein